MSKSSPFIVLACAALLLATAGVQAQSTPAPSPGTAAPAPDATHKVPAPDATHKVPASSTPAPAPSTNAGTGG